LGIPATDRSFSYSPVVVATIDDGAIARMVYESDMIGLIQQLGVVD
jgi:hypothetical protein